MDKLGEMFQTAEGNASYEMEALRAEDLLEIASRIERRFGFESTGRPVFGVDSVHLGLRRGPERITVGWDNWTGVFVSADDSRGNRSVQQIADYLETVREEIGQVAARAAPKS